MIANPPQINRLIGLIMLISMIQLIRATALSCDQPSIIKGNLKMKF